MASPGMRALWSDRAILQAMLDVEASLARAAALLSAIYAPLTGGAYYQNADAIEGTCSVASPSATTLPGA